MKDRYTNHSLRATSVSRMFRSGIAEKVIVDKSGHRSVAGVRAYELVSEVQEREAQLAIGLKEKFRLI